MSVVLDASSGSTGPIRAGSAGTAPGADGSRRPSAPPPVPDLVLVGGVPGAGKSTVLARLARTGDDLRVVDPDRHRARLAARVGRVLPYRAYRPVVHGLHATAVALLVLRGPGRLGARALVVHEPATRRRRTGLVVRLARARGWCPALVYVDASRDQALAGQHARGRVLRPASFEGHWRRWTADRDRLLVADREGTPIDGWHRVSVVRRHDAEARLRALLGAC